jgi:hypothetical protein
MASKSTGSAAAMGATSPDGSSAGGGQDKKLATTFYQSRQIQHLHIELRNEAKWRCCHGKMGAETQANAVIGGLWSVLN